MSTVLRISPALADVAVAAGPGATVATRRTTAGGPGARRGTYVGQRAFSNTADTVHHFEWDGRRWVYRGFWRLGSAQA